MDCGTRHLRNTGDVENCASSKEISLTKRQNIPYIEEVPSLLEQTDIAQSAFIHLEN
jgi:hypothetical protein